MRLFAENELKEKKWPIVTAVAKKRKKVKRNNSIITFDIETTSAWMDSDGNVIGYHKGETDDYWNNKVHIALCYIWQCSIDGIVYYGRELESFLSLLNMLPEAETIIWVHNLAYEFCFLENILHWESVFARTPHSPIKAVAEEYPHITFKCSYTLTGLKLESWGKQLGIPKLVGDLDYEKLRTPYTELTEAELRYCEYDCLIVDAGIKKYVERYGSMFDIPLTQTGTVRIPVKEKLWSGNEKYTSYIKRLIPKSAKEYKMLQDVFAGGYTHSNRYHAGYVIYDLVTHWDFASSYPTVMCCEGYPCTPWVYVGHNIPNDERFEREAFIMILTFTNIECNTFNTYIQRSKCTGENIRCDNGRVISADRITITITEQDWLTIKDTYSWGSVYGERIYSSFKKYLPKALIEYILELYGNKTSLKNVEGMEDLYLQSKQYINSLYGMSVTSLINADVVYTEDGWYIEGLDEEAVNKKLDKLKVWYPTDRRYFMSYSWGCWVTAYARRNLWKCIIPNDQEVVYCDTDSIFVIGEPSFDWYNEDVTDKLRKMCNTINIDFELTRPKTPKGIPKPLGIFDREEDCIEFVTLGAKRYCERRKDGKLYLTVSGINKEAVELLNDDITNFRDGLVFDKDSDSVTKRLHHYLTDIPEVTYPDGYHSKYKRGINLRRTGYKLTMTDEYKRLINYFDMDVSQIPPNGIIKLRGLFK